ncbi:MAG: hypothetical protein H0V44_17840 [Planctomycetes bacterium]|nr:hypothetical protein [Planctomycetota bacterium]
MDDKIIRFPSAKPAVGDTGTDEKPGAAAKGRPRTAASEPLATDGLNEDQRKAIGIVLSGMSFVLVGIKPTDRGADFFTVVTGDGADLRNAQPHLAGTIDKAYSRKGV